MRHYQVVIPVVMITSVLKLFHESAPGGHTGIADTLDRIRQFYYFERMGAYVSDFVRSCADCQQRKVTKPTTRSPITAYPTPSKPFQVVQVDHYGPLSASPQGNTYILTAVCSADSSLQFRCTHRCSDNSHSLVQDFYIAWMSRDSTK